jgi:hypothetical protein
MSFYDALEILFGESSFYEAFALFASVVLIYYVTFKARLASILDPIAYVLAMSAVSVTFLLLLTFHGLVSLQKCVFVVLTLALFYFGFLMVDSSARESRQKRQIEFRLPRVSNMTLAILFWANFVVLAIIYIFFGVPLFLESRLAQFTDSGGFGVLNRLATGLEFATLVVGFISIRHGRNSRKWAIAIIVQFMVSALLSGSKGSLLSGLFAWYLSHVYNSKSWFGRPNLPRSMVAFLWLVIVSPLLIISIQSAGEADGAAGVVGRLATRIAAEGDGYAYFLVNDRIDAVAKHDAIAPLRQVLVALRVLPREGSVNPGLEIIREVLSVDSPSLGPNSRLPIYILFFYGYSGIVFAPVLGMAFGWVRNRLRQRGQGDPVKFALMAVIYLYCCKIEIDPQLSVDGLFDLGLTLPIFFVAMALGGRYRTAHKRSRQSVAIEKPVLQ